MVQLSFPNDDGSAWIITRDGDPNVRKVFDRHYSRTRYKDGRKPKLILGPGQKLVLRTARCDAIFGWRKYISDDGQDGVNCAFFRNEGPRLSSDLILEAESIAWARWPGERFYTYVDSRRVKSTNPGYCFLMAGWRKCGLTKVRKLTILEKLPDGMA